MVCVLDWIPEILEVPLNCSSLLQSSLFAIFLKKWTFVANFGPNNGQEPNFPVLTCSEFSLKCILWSKKVQKLPEILKLLGCLSVCDN